MRYLRIYTCMLLSLLLLFSCQEDTISPDVFGSISGEAVLLADENQAVADAKITTSPVTTTVYTDDFGLFTLENVKAGTYSVRIEKEGYAIETESIAVNENEVTDVLFKLQIDTSTNEVPSSPELIQPANSSTNQALSLQMSWTSSDSDPEDELRFDVQLFTAGQQDIQEVLSNSLVR
ncbi:MAG: carboxypeptidase-like regulatory domain-containing protein [Bacteroidota bacterium]